MSGLNPITHRASDIATWVKRQFGDESGVQVTDQDIFRWIDSAQNEIVTTIAPLKAKARTSLIKGQRDYQLPDMNIRQIESVHANQQRLDYMAFAEAERKVKSSNDAFNKEGSPLLWWEWAGEISLWPTPDKDIEDGLVIYYTKMPVKILAGSDLLSLSDKFFEAICAWVLSKAYELDEEFGQSATQRAYFENKIQNQHGEEQDVMNMTYPTITFIED